MSSTPEHVLLEEIIKAQKETNELLRQYLTTQHTPSFSQTCPNDHSQPRDGHDDTPPAHCRVDRPMALTLSLNDYGIYFFEQFDDPSLAPQCTHDYEVSVAPNNEEGEPTYVMQFYITLPPRLKLLTWHDFPLKEPTLPAITLNRVVEQYTSGIGVENQLVPWEGVKVDSPIDRVLQLFFQQMTLHEWVVWYALSRFVTQTGQLPTDFKIVSFHPSDKSPRIKLGEFRL